MFYHLGELDDALNYAMHAGQLFHIDEQSEYVQTLIGKRTLLVMPVHKVGTLIASFAAACPACAREWLTSCQQLHTKQVHSLTSMHT